MALLVACGVVALLASGLARRPLRAPATLTSGAESEGAAVLDDDDAVRRARSGDLDAYEVLVTRYSAVAHRTAVLLGAGADAEDVVQDSFVKAFGALDRFRAGAPFRPWLLKIVVNETKNLHRGRRRRTGGRAAGRRPGPAGATPSRSPSTGCGATRCSPPSARCRRRTSTW